MGLAGSLARRTSGRSLPGLCFFFVILCANDCARAFPQDQATQQATSQSLTGTLHDAAGAPMAGVPIKLTSPSGNLTAVSASDGTFQFSKVPVCSYSLSVETGNGALSYPQPILMPTVGSSLAITVPSTGALTVAMLPVAPVVNDQKGSGGEQLSSKAVSELPLNKRDFSQLLLLAAGTMTDANGATNFTAQFAINGQRGVEAVFAMDGADTSDPEMGGATFSNFNVDAVEGIQSSSGWMPAEIGRGAAGFTNIVTRSGSSGFHGSVFEFVRNSAFDARNYFDHPSIAEPRRIPPFRRNEFGFTNGGPVVIPLLCDGRKRTFYFTQYQGFREVLGTTQVMPEPTASERARIDVVNYKDSA